MGGLQGLEAIRGTVSEFGVLKGLVVESGRT